jgi:hypothetical protein
VDPDKYILSGKLAYLPVLVHLFYTSTYTRPMRYTYRYEIDLRVHLHVHTFINPLFKRYTFTFTYTFKFTCTFPLSQRCGSRPFWSGPPDLGSGFSIWYGSGSDFSLRYESGSGYLIQIRIWIPYCFKNVPMFLKWYF